MSHGRVGAGGFVRRAAGQDELAVGDDVALAGGRGSPGAEWYRSASSNQIWGMTIRSQKVMQRCRGETVTRSARSGCSAPTARSSSSGWCRGVGVGKEQQVAPRGAISLNAGPGLSVPALSAASSPLQQSESGIRGKPAHDGGGVIGGSIVHHQ